jgi:hypothetical protein
MSDLKQWIWPAAAGTMGTIVAFGAGVIAGDQWVTIGLRSREQSTPSAVLDTSALRPMVHEEVERGVADAIASRRESRPVEAAIVNQKESRLVDAPVAAAVRKETRAPEPSATASAARKDTRKTEVASATSASQAAKAAALVTLIRSIRSQMTQYKSDHFDRYPKFAQLQENWASLTQPTNTDGSLAGGTRGVLGPYLQSIPINPLTNSSELAPAGMPTSTCGWTYDEKTGRIKAFVPAGHPGGDLIADVYVERGGRRIIQTASANSER